MTSNVVCYEHEGTSHFGTYTVSGKSVTTTSILGKKSAPVGRSTPALAARWLLGDIVRGRIQGSRP